MPAGALMTAGAFAIVILWVASAILAVVFTIRWLWANSRTDAFSSVVCTGLAGAPGVLILVESIVRYIEHSTTGSSPQAFEFWSTLISCAWFIVGPILLIEGAMRRARLRETPPGTTFVQLLHVAMWGWSAGIGMLYAATV
jgi:hypothetical protein